MLREEENKSALVQQWILNNVFYLALTAALWGRFLEGKGKSTWRQLRLSVTLSVYLSIFHY